MKIGTLLDKIAEGYAEQNRRDDEFDAAYYAKHRGIAVRTARDQLRAAESDGLLTSRMAIHDGHLVRLYREAGAEE